MTNNIDKDISLLFPKSSKYLLLGGNFLFSKRLYEIMKRQFKIKRIDYDYTLNSKYLKFYKNFDKKTKALIDLHESDTIIFTSEVLLFLSNNDFYSLVNSIKEIQKLNVKFIFVSINNPLHFLKKENEVYELTNAQTNGFYNNRLSKIESLLDINKDLIFSFSSYCTYTSSNIQINLLDLINNNNEFDICESECENKFYLTIADYIIDDIILNLNNKNKIYFNENKSEIITLLEIKNNFHTKNLYKYINSQLNCSLNLIYRKKPHEEVNGNSIANWRFNLGFSLKENIPKKIIDELEYIIPVPETGKYYAQGLSHALNVPYLEALYKKSEVGRSFDIANLEKREKFINSKLGLIGDSIKNKSIGIVDEAIFSGQTLKVVMELLNNADVKNVYFFIASPMYKCKCIYNMQPDRELICETKSINDLILYFNINDIFFQNMDSYEKILKKSGFECVGCFSK